MFILIILFWVKEVVKKEVLWEWGFGFSLGFWGTFFECFLSASNCAILRIKNTLKKKKKENLDLKGAIEEEVGCFLVYLF